MNKKFRIKQGLIYMILIVISVVFLIPFIWLVRSSLMDLKQIFIIPPEWIPNPVKWDNYPNALTYIPFARYFINTILIVVVSLTGIFLTSTLSAYSFARLRWMGRDLFFALILATMMLPSAVTLIPTFIGWKSIGLYNTYAPLIVPAFFGGGAFNIFLLRQFYMTLPFELDEAAKIDGAGYFMIYWRIILPLSRSAVIVVGIFAFMFYWNDFFGPLIYLSKPINYTLALGLQLFRSMYFSQWNLLMAASTVVILPCIIIFLIGQKYFIQGIALSGLKG